jgi:PKD repeat protein
MPAGMFNINIGNSGKTIELRDKSQKKPVADFTAALVSGKAPLQVKFTDKSTASPKSWNWNFGDGKTSTEQNPKHAYSKGGRYTVCLTASNDAGKSTIKKTYDIYSRNR